MNPWRWVWRPPIGSHWRQWVPARGSWRTGLRSERDVFDPGITRAHNALVIVRGLKALPALLAALSLAAAGVLPMEHAHVRGHDDDHHGEVVHRHLASHHAADTTAVEADDDGDVLWIADSYVVPGAFHAT